MAQSARTASLLAQRGRSPYSSSGSIRILAPQNNAIASIAKKTIANELDVMVSRYNAGEVSNDDMKAFLEKARSSVGISDADKLEITNQIRDFDSRILKDKLELAYQSAPENSLQQYQASQALANYYNDRASQMAAGTPAQTTALQNATTWSQKGMDIRAGIAKQADQAYRYSQEQKINALPNNSPERAYEKAQMYLELANRAAASGDQNDALKYQSYYQQQLTTAEEIATKAVAAENKKTVTDFINTTINDYHDGKITGDQALANLMEADKFAADQNDYATQNRINSLGMTINREIDKGITYSSVNGVSVKSKGGGSGGGGEIYLNPDGTLSYGGGTAKSTGTGIGTKVGGTTKTGGKAAPKTTNTKVVGGSGDQSKSLDQLEIEYKNGLADAARALTSGRVQTSDGKWIPFNGNDYTKAVSVLGKNRQLQLQNINSGLEAILAANPKAKIGKTQVKTIYEDTAKQLQSVTAEYNGINTGRFVLTLKSNDAGVPQYTFVPKGKEGDMVENKGVYYPTRQTGVQFNTEEEAKNYIKLNSTKDSKLGVVYDGVKYKITDSESNDIKKNEFDILDADGNVVTYEEVEGYGWLPKPVGPKTTALRNQIIKEFDEAKKTGGTYKANLLNYNELVSRDINSPVGKTILPTEDSTPVGQINPQRVIGAVQNIANKAANVINPTEPVNKNIVIPASAKISQPAMPIPSATANFRPNTGVVQNAPSAPTLKLATAPVAPAAKVLPKNTPLPAPKGAPSSLAAGEAAIKKAQQTANNNPAVKITNTISNLATKIKGLFGR